VAGIEGELARLYDVFVDWEGRLGREMPGLLRAIEGAERVLDVGCGTGRHVAALLAEGYDASGADVSEDMLAQAREFTGAPERFVSWRMGDPAPFPDASFDAITCLGNVWPQLVEEKDVQAACAELQRLLRPGGRFVAGLKAVEARRGGNPYMPLLRREHEGQPLFFVRFVDFDPSDRDRCTFHMLVAGAERVHHRETVVRVWSPDSLRRTFEDAGFEDVRVSGRLGEPGASTETEDVFLHARRRTS